MTNTRPGPDERRVRAILRRRGVSLGTSEEQPLPPAPEHLPPGFPTRPRDWLDDVLDGNADTPTPRPAPAPIADPPAEATAPEPDERRDWSWLMRWIRPWQSFTAGAVSVLPLFNGWSLATGWARALHEMRTDTLAGAYTTALLALGAAFLLDKRRKRWLLRLALITTAVGSLGVLDWFDPITFVTGVHR
ncbi:hypothetical protein ACVHNB_32810 [Streptomyces sp. YJ-C3]